MDRSSKEKNQEGYCGTELHSRSNELIDIYRLFHPKAKYTFFTNAHRSFSKIGHMVGHRTNLNKFKKIEIIRSIFLDHNGLKLETNLRGKTQKH